MICEWGGGGGMRRPPLPPPPVRNQGFPMMDKNKNIAFNKTI